MTGAESYSELGLFLLGKEIENTLNNKIPLIKWEKLAPKWDLNSKLPWYNINVGINKDFLKEEFIKALNGDLTPWCETFGCYDCGSCNYKNK